MIFKNWRVIHKWLAIGVGVFLLAWTISGIFMVLPDEWFDPAPVKPTGQINYKEIGVAPQAAISQLEADLGSQVQVNNLGLKRLQRKLYYWITLEDGSYHLIDAVTGKEFKITEQTAKELIGLLTGVQADSIQIQPLSGHDMLYPFGPLPVFRIRLLTGDGDIYYVSMITGDISHSTFATRVRAVITSLHTFEPIRFVTQRDSIRKLLLVSVASVAVVVALTGYILAVQPGLRRRAKARRSTRTIE